MLNIFKSILKTKIEELVFNKNDHISSLRYLFSSGEELHLIQVQEYHNILPNTRIYNLYGPTEASIDILYYDCTNQNIKTICIGKPIANSKAYVLNANQQPLPIGAIG